MSTTSFDLLKQQASSLTSREKFMLANYLLEQARQDERQDSSAAPRANAEADDERRQHLEWLKAHREEYAGQYVALYGDRLVGRGQTLRGAREQARQNGVTQPFLVRVTSENETMFGGW